MLDPSSRNGHSERVADDEDDGYPTPEGAALAEWNAYPEAQARVISVEYTDADHAIVVIDTDPSHPECNNCERTECGWILLSTYN